MNCRFCSFAACNEVFEQASELSIPEAVERARRAETEGANALYLMITADYPFAKYLEVAGAVRQSLRPETPMVANVGDLSLRQAQQLRQTGFAGIYHAVRLGEGHDTSIPVERRLRTMQHAREAGLLIGTCLEPVGPEHAIDELVAKTVITRDARPVYSGAARRIPIPGTQMAKLGMVSKARMAHIVAVVRLVLPRTVPGNCTHEPDVYGTVAGASLLWSEAGANPRDTAAETEGKHGMTTGVCREYFAEADWQVFEGPSRWLTAAIHS
jgi:biotin synthase